MGRCEFVVKFINWLWFSFVKFLWAVIIVGFQMSILVVSVLFKCQLVTDATSIKRSMWKLLVYSFILVFGWAGIVLHIFGAQVHFTESCLRISPGESAVVEALLYLMQPDIITIYIFPYNNILKLHFVTSQCASLISQYILNLAQLFVDRHCVALHKSIIDGATHLFVLGHGISLEYLHKLQRNDQWDWDVSGI